MSTAGVPTAPPRAPGLAALAAGLFAIVVLALLAWSAVRGPTQPAQDAPPPLDGMMRHVSELAASPRPIATSMNAAARDYIVGQLRAMGLAPMVQTTTVQKSSIRYWGGNVHMTIGLVHNIVVRLPGSAADRLRRPALLLATHYDSGKNTLGAARGASQVAAMLETARALKNGPAHANDILLLFMDGEDVGGLGAKGFAEQHPLAREVGLTLKFDAAGSAGPLTLYDAAGAGSSALRGRALALGADGSSLMARLVKMLPDTPRIGPLAAIDAPILLFVNTGRRLDAEGTLDSVERLDPAMVARLGENMLRLARHYGDATLARGGSQPHAWFTLPLAGGVQHPAILGWGLGALCVLMLVRGYRRALVDSGNTVAPVLQGIFGIALLLVAARMLLWERHEELSALTRLQDSGPAIVFLVAGSGLFIGALYLLRRFAGGVSVFLGAMAWLSVALLLILLKAPDTAWLLAWPLTAALAAFTALQAPQAQDRALLRLLILAAGLAPALLLMLPALRDTWAGLAPQGLYVPAVVIAMMLLCFASLFLLLPLGRVVIGAVVLALAACVALPGQSATPLLQERPSIAPNRLVYLKDMNSWRSWWLLPPEALDPWSKQLFPNLERPAINVDAFGWHSPRQWYAVAPKIDDIAFPEAFLLRSPRLAKPKQEPKLRQVEFTLRSKNRAPHIEMWAAGSKPHRSTLNGHALTSKESAWSLSLYGMEDQLLRFTIDVPDVDVLAVIVEERMPGLPEHLLPPGAPKRMPGTGMTVASDVLWFY
ncbi:M28 family peptidase [Massilia sp. IC2-476]|uniref:M28 family peptidase n=1 Tax=Massilia sp. IC2-476 TaxID=2887199 RepID=UPI001D10C255|nr:M28 family peptidase [Massilia sp. IC2-476]MCC2974713.1 M28 family peptidase [Massilia sp. IC2-476]